MYKFRRAAIFYSAIHISSDLLQAIDWWLCHWREGVGDCCGEHVEVPERSICGLMLEDLMACGSDGRIESVACVKAFFIVDTVVWSNVSAPVDEGGLEASTLFISRRRWDCDRQIAVPRRPPLSGSRRLQTRI